MYIDYRQLDNGMICQHPDITVDRDDIVDTVMKEYLLKHGLVLADVGVYYGKPAFSGYSCMGKDNTFGDDRWHYHQGDTMTIWMHKRTSALPAEPLKYDVSFVEENEPHDRVFTGKTYCFEILQRVLNSALDHFHMEIEEVVFSIRGNAVDGETMTAHELFTANGLAKGDALTITVKYTRPAVLVRVVYDDRVFQQVCTESPLRRIRF